MTDDEINEINEKMCVMRITFEDGSWDFKTFDVVPGKKLILMALDEFNGKTVTQLQFSGYMDEDLQFQADRGLSVPFVKTNTMELTLDPFWRDSLTMEEYALKVTVIVTPDGAPKQHPHGGVAYVGSTSLRLYTVGLVDFDRPELEMRHVPALFVEQAHQLLNRWGYYSVTEREIHDGEILQEGSEVVEVLLQAQESEYGEPFLNLHSEAVIFIQCDHPEHNHGMKH